MKLLSVWYIENGMSSGSGVLVSVRKPGGITEQRLLTAQHVIRPHNDITGSYSAVLKAWPPEVGYNSDTAIHLEIDRFLTPDENLPLEDPEDLAFLKLPPGKTGSTPTSLLPYAECTAPLKNLMIYGYAGGRDSMAVNSGRVHPAYYDSWNYDEHNATSGIGILANGSGPPLAGVSGGGVFMGSRYLGIYRGLFTNVGQHLFLPITRVRDWLATRGWELVDSLDAQVDTIKRGFTDLKTLMKNSSVKAKIDASRVEMQKLKSALADFRLYKLLHDHLHAIQMHYVNAAKAARTEPFDDGAVDNFDWAVSAIRTEHLRARETIDSIPSTSLIRPERESRWLKKLEIPLEQARVGIPSGDTAFAVCSKIAHVLRQDLTRINEELVTSAQMMNLGRLDQLFNEIGQLPEMSPANAAEFADAGSACENVRQAIAGKTEIHDRWQGIDLEFWEAERAALSEPSVGLGDLRVPGTSSQRNLAACSARIPRRPRISKTAPRRWPNSLTLTHGRKCAGNFHQFSRNARELFFKVDMELKGDAEKIAELEQPLEPFT